jgi:hypothetical protein
VIRVGKKRNAYKNTEFWWGNVSESFHVEDRRLQDNIKMYPRDVGFENW